MAIPGEVVLVDDVPAAFSQRMIEAFRSRPLDTFSIALSGGNTARECYECLADTAGSQIDWWKVDIYWGDERCVPHDHVDSNYRLAREALLRDTKAPNLYQVGCVYALTSKTHSDDRREALRLIRSAFQAGFGLDIAEADADLDPIRDDPDFRDLLRDARRLHGPNPR